MKTTIIRWKEDEGFLDDFVKDLEKIGTNIINVIITEFRLEKGAIAGQYSTSDKQKPTKALIIVN